MNRDEAAALAARLNELAAEGRRADRALIKRARTGHPTQRLLARRVYHQLLPPGVDHAPWNIDLVERAASLFVVNPAHASSGPGVGEAARALASRPGVSEDAVERLFTALIAAGPDTADIHLARLFARLCAEGIPIDYVRLVLDLRWLGHPERHVQRRWADQFWGTPAAAPVNDSTGGAQP